MRGAKMGRLFGRTDAIFASEIDESAIDAMKQNMDSSYKSRREKKKNDRKQRRETRRTTGNTSSLFQEQRRSKPWKFDYIKCDMP
jgi:hypothetical protein